MIRRTCFFTVYEIRGLDESIACATVQLPSPPISTAPVDILCLKGCPIFPKRDLPLDP